MAEPISTASLGPIRLDVSAAIQQRERAEAVLERHSPSDRHAISNEERRRWIVDAMTAFAAAEVRRDREARRG